MGPEVLHRVLKRWGFVDAGLVPESRSQTGLPLPSIACDRPLAEIYSKLGF
jgi:hypothetical protein